MAIAYYYVTKLSRGSGHNAVRAAAYRHRTRMEDKREAHIVDYSAKEDLRHEEFVLPNDAPGWARTMAAGKTVSGMSEALWNRVESFEKRKDAQVAAEMTIALPIELSTEENIALVREFVESHITAKGMIADWAYHDAPGNPHVHIMATLRPLTEDGFGAKTVIAGPKDNPTRDAAGKIVFSMWAWGRKDFNTTRDGWFACLNRHLALAGLDIFVDGRSYKRQGADLEPSVHIGAVTMAVEQKLGRLSLAPPLPRRELHEARRRENVRRILTNPEIVLGQIAREKSVFDERDVAKILHRYIDDAAVFEDLMARILRSPQTLPLDRGQVEFATGVRTPPKYTTRDLIRLEAKMANQSVWLSQQSSHGVQAPVLSTTFMRHDHLSDEQQAAIEHVVGRERIAVVVGRAGSGKTTMMRAAREAWEGDGYRVIGGALAAKAAEGLGTEAAIVSRTLSAWERRWREGQDQLDDRTVFVLDEAGMVASRQMALFVDAATRTGAKLVLIGDPDQLQPIEAGAAFRAIADRIGYRSLETIYRQNEQWMRDVSLDLARGRIDGALDAYGARGKVIGSALKADAVTNLVSDWNSDYDPTKTSLILAHLRRDVRLLNDLARARLVERGIVDEGYAFVTADGDRKFAAGDQIVFLKNEGALGVKNGMLGKVVTASAGQLVAEVGSGEHRRQVAIRQSVYNQIDHGYATTIHKSQGATVDRVKVMASLSLDRHLTYVAMTRHREDLAIYYGRQSFLKNGGLVAMLSRSNLKETTLDYQSGHFYAQALRFAEARGLHLLQVARTILQDRLDWTVRQASRLAELGARLGAVAIRLGLADGSWRSVLNPMPQLDPMVSGIKVFRNSITQAVEDKIATDRGLNAEWQLVSSRFYNVFADPHAAFKAINVDRMLTDLTVAKATIARIADQPESFGALNGKTGLFASRANIRAREIALLNVPALARDLDDYFSRRTEAERRYTAEEQSERVRLSIDVPALSAAAGRVLENVRDAIHREDLSGALELAMTDRRVKAELDGFANAVKSRFGERAFLGLDAKNTDGKTFETLSTGMQPNQKSEFRAAWDMLRAIQRLSAHERSKIAREEAEAMRLKYSKGLSMRL